MALVAKPRVEADYIILSFTIGLASALGHRNFDIHVAYNVMKYGFRVEVTLHKTDASGRRMKNSIFIPTPHNDEAFYRAELIPPPEMVAALMLMDS